MSASMAAAPRPSRIWVPARISPTLSATYLLRSRYPNLAINFSTVLSHLNVAEVERIVVIAAQVGANSVNISPINHTPHLDLRRSDWHKFLTELERARPIAASSGVSINVSVAKEHFTAPDDRSAFRVLPEPLPKAVP